MMWFLIMYLLIPGEYPQVALRIGPFETQATCEAYFNKNVDVQSGEMWGCKKEHV